MSEHEENSSDSYTGGIAWLLLGVLVVLLAGGGVAGVVLWQAKEMQALDERKRALLAEYEALEAQKAVEQKAAEQKEKP